MTSQVVEVVVRVTMVGPEDRPARVAREMVADALAARRAHWYNRTFVAETDITSREVER
jgi:hypothetical protein